MVQIRSRRRGRIAVSLALVALLVVPTGAAGHAELSNSEPEDGATVAVAPDLIVAAFTEVLAEGSGMVLRDSVGATLAEGGIDGSSDTRMTIDPPALVGGEYEVRWTAVAGDGHVERGSFSFVVTPTAVSPSPAPTVEVTAPPTASPTETPGSPEPLGPGGDTSGTAGTDALIPIIAALAVVAILGGYLLSRRRTTPRP
jgi:methionine-rich copper-binding protein CopC